MSPIAEVTIAPPDSFMDVIERSDPEEIAKVFLEHEFILIRAPDESEDDDKIIPLTAEIEGDDVMVAFLSMDKVHEFGQAMPDMVGADGSVPVFTTSGESLLENVPDDFGIMLNPECDDGLVIPPELVVDIKEAARELQAQGPANRKQVPESARAREIREEAFAFLESRGFRPAKWLPMSDVDRQVRPITEIAARLMGLATVFTWGSAPSDAVSSESIREFIKKNRLKHAFTPDEAKILSTPRSEARKEYGDSVGWRLENMWPLAWVLGFEHEPTIEASQIDNSITEAIMFGLLAGVTREIDDLIANSKLRSADEVLKVEDRFYCAHNAVRSAQLGNDTVPEDFHPLAHGGAVHERRHSLTWCLSPGTAWDDTDLST